MQTKRQPINILAALTFIVATFIGAGACEWYSHPDPKLPFPCQPEETAFRSDCPDFDLYNETN